MGKLDYNQFNFSGTVKHAMITSYGGLRLVLNQKVLGKYDTDLIVLCPSYTKETCEYCAGDELLIQNAVVFSNKNQYGVHIESENQIKRLELSPEDCDLGEERAEKKFEPYL